MRTSPGHGRRRAGQFLSALPAAVLLAVLAVGVPWGLMRFIGWPLPGHVPAWSEVRQMLLTPMSSRFFLDTLACVLWPVWTLFVLDVVRAAAEVMSDRPSPSVPRRKAGPLQTAAVILVGSVVLSLLSRSSTPAAGPANPNPAAIALVGDPAPVRSEPTDAIGTVTVHAPRGGVYDSLWRIAERGLGDGNRWPEIYHLNRDRPQADGRTLTNPNLIRPGWILDLPTPRLPAQPRTPPPPRRPPPLAATPPATSPTPRATTPTPSPNTRPLSTTSAPWTPPGQHADKQHHHQGPGVDLPGGGFVGIGLATAVAAALLTVRMRRRARYRPGSGSRDDLTIAPVVRALRIAHDTASTGSDDSTVEPDAAPTVPAPARVPVEGHIVGVVDGRPLAWELARTRGLGLVGPGAADAVRALLLALLAEHDRPVDVLIPVADARLLLADGSDEELPLHTVVDIDAGLDILEAEILTRLRTGGDGKPGADSHGPIVLVATPSEHAARRLQAILDNGSTLGLAGVFLGQWLPGGTARVRVDGTVAAASSDVDELTGARLFTLPVPGARDLLDLLAEASRTRSPTFSSLVRARPRTDGSERRHSTQSAATPRGITPTDPEPAERARDQPDADADPLRATRPRPEPAAAAPARDSARPLRLTVLGRIQLLHMAPAGGQPFDLTPALAPKQREVLAFLALRRDGVRRETLAAGLWPDAPRDRPYNSFHATLSQFRRALRTATRDELSDVTRHVDGHYSLDRDQMTADLWDLQDALDAVRDGGDQRRAVERALELYTGDLAAELTAEWVEAPRESLRRDLLDAVSALVREVRTIDPYQALALLERVRALDPYNEAIYRGIARLQARLGQHDTLPRTLVLLTTVLAEIDEEPSPQTLALFSDLRRPRRTGRPDSGPAASEHAAGGGRTSI